MGGITTYLYVFVFPAAQYASKAHSLQRGDRARQFEAARSSIAHTVRDGLPRMSQFTSALAIRQTFLLFRISACDGTTPKIRHITRPTLVSTAAAA
jgi:hypothetical protein